MGKPFRVYRACNINMKYVKYPTWIMPKIDGVRGSNPFGTLLTRTLALMPNLHTRECFSKPSYVGIDGELACGLETDDDLCRKTTSAVMTESGEPVVIWHAFDLCSPNAQNAKYSERYEMLKNWIDYQHSIGLMLDVQVVPYQIVNNEDEFNYWENIWLNMGYEGVVQRDPDAPYKWGKSTEKQCGYTRRKPYEDTEAILIDVIEAEENLNEAFTDAQGLSKRSSHQENKIGKGMAGCLIGKRLDTGAIERIGPGKLTHEERVRLWETRFDAIEQEVKFKFRHFPKGVKDKARQARFLSWRDERDILPEE